MKFKVIFAIFNAIIISAFAFVFLMPVFVIGFDGALGFWGQNWYLAVLFLVVLGLLDLWFIGNWKLFTLLEKEDWAGVADWLHGRIFDQGRITDQNVRLYCNALVLLGRIGEIRPLETLLREKYPKRLPAYAVLLGVPYVLGRDHGESMAFFQALMDEPATRVTDRDWLRFFLSFAHLGAERPDLAKPLVEALAREAKDPVVRMAALHMAAPLESPGREAWRQDLVSRVPRQRMNRLLEASRDQLHIMLLSKYLVEALEGVYAPAPQVG